MGEARRKTTLIVEVDMEELTCRIAEAAMGVKRPVSKTAAEALSDIEGLTKRVGEIDVVPGFRRAASVSAQYVAECLQKGRRPS